MENNKIGNGMEKNNRVFDIDTFTPLDNQNGFFVSLYRSMYLDRDSKKYAIRIYVSSQDKHDLNVVLKLYNDKIFKDEDLTNLLHKYEIWVGELYGTNCQRNKQNGALNNALNILRK